MKKVVCPILPPHETIYFNKCLSFGTLLEGTHGHGYTKENCRKDHPAVSVTRQAASCVDWWFVRQILQEWRLWCVCSVA